MKLFAITIVVVGALLSRKVAATEVSSLQHIRQDLYTAEYQIHINARTQLRMLTKSTDEIVAAQAQATLAEFFNVAKKWLDSHAEVDGFPGLARVDLSITEDVAPNDLVYLYAVEGIHSLHIQGKSATDEYVRTISKLPGLKRLEIHETATTGKALNSIELPDVEIMRLTSSPVNETLILEGMPMIRLLDLSNTPLTDSMLEKLATSKVESIWLGGTKVSGNVTTSLQRFEQLSHLRVEAEVCNDELAVFIQSRGDYKSIVIYCDNDDEQRHAQKFVATLPSYCRSEIR